MTILPSPVAGILFKAPLKLPTGVLTALAIMMSFISWLSVIGFTDY